MVRVISSHRDARVLRDHDGKTARMIVADSGEGIAPAELDRIFDRFRSGSQLGGTRGTGLGLALAVGRTTVEEL